jgi:putative hydrolase of the HAD superfamily
MIDTVLLDLGNVLLFHDNALLFRRLGERAKLTGAEVGRLLEPLWEDINKGRLDEAGIVREVNRALGTRFSGGEFFELFNSHFSVHEAVLPRVEALFGRVKVGLLSNTNATHARWFLPRLPILGRFDQVLLSHEVGAAKPDPRFFGAALERLGALPSRTLFFDDLPPYVEAAKGLGLFAEVFTTAERFAAQLAAYGL